jgi:hypothetical protein
MNPWRGDKTKAVDETMYAVLIVRSYGTIVTQTYGETSLKRDA